MTVSAVGANSADTAQLNLALQYLSNSPSASFALSQNVQVNINHQDMDVVIGMSTAGTRDVQWDPGSALVVVSASGVQGVQSAAMGLIHEIAHAIYGSDEASATAFESKVAVELGEPTRANYDSQLGTITTQNSTEHTHNGQWTEREPTGSTTVGAMYNGSTSGAAPTISGSGTSGGYSAPGSTGYVPGGSGGGIYGGSTDDDGGGSVYCPACHVQADGVHITVPPESLAALDALLVGTGGTAF